MNDTQPFPRRDTPKHSRDLRRSASQRMRAGSGATTADSSSSVASILSSSDQLIPEAFQPVDIQVLSQRQRQRRPSRAGTSSQGTLSSSALFYSRGSTVDAAPLSHCNYYSGTSVNNSAFQPPKTNPSARFVGAASDTSDEHDLLLGSSRASSSGHGAPLSTRDLVRGCA